MRTLLLLLVLTLSLAACKSVQVSSDHDPNADFGRLSTWDWMPRTGSADPIHENTLVTNRIRDAITRELEAKGYVTAEGAGASFLVGFETQTREHLDVTTWPSWPYRGFGRRGRWHGGYGWGAGWSHVSVTEFTSSTLVVGFVDPATNALLWRGTASSVRDEDSESAERIDEAVRELLEEFPPGAE